MLRRLAATAAVVLAAGLALAGPAHAASTPPPPRLALVGHSYGWCWWLPAVHLPDVRPGPVTVTVTAQRADGTC